MWEKAHEKLIGLLKKKWKSTGNITLTEHIASFRGIIAKIVRACKHTDHTSPTEREQVLLIINSIDTTESLLQAHISSINGDPTGRGSSFESTATHLMLADPVERNQSKQSRKISISSTLAGRGSGTGVDLRWYPNWEYKKLDDKEKKELGDWRKTPAGEAAMKKSREEAAKKRKPKSGSPGGDGANDNSAKRQKKFDKAVQKQAKQIVASAMEADEQDYAEFTARIDAAIKKRSETSVSVAEVRAAEVPKEDSTEPEAKESQRAVKLASIMRRVGDKRKKNVTVEG